MNKMISNKWLMRFVSGLLFCSLLTACVPRRPRYTLPADMKGPKELSRMYNMRLTPDDNIFLYNEGARWLGVPYRAGGLTEKGVDCSGLVLAIYWKLYDKNLSRSSSDMLKYNCRKIKRENLREGDLVFFRTSGRGNGKKQTPDHVGIYLKNSRFIHASSSRGVIVSSLNEPYYLRTWLTGGRVK